MARDTRLKSFLCSLSALTGSISFNLDNSTTRVGSLYPNFALQLDKLVIGNSSESPGDQGFLTVTPMTPSGSDFGFTSLDDNWFGFSMILNMGTLGKLSSDAGLVTSMMIAWSPGSTGNTYSTLIGLKMPGTNPKAKILGIQGVLKLTISDLQLVFDDTNKTFALLLTDIALKFLSIAKLPPGGQTNFFLFGNPKSDADSQSLGWYAAYNKSS